MKKFKTLREEIANSVGSGAIPGVGVNPPDKPANWGEPGVSKKEQKKIQDNQTSVVMRRKAIFEDVGNKITKGMQLDPTTHMQDEIDDQGEAPHRVYDVSDTHRAMVWDRKHPRIPGATIRTTILVRKKQGEDDKSHGLVDARLQSLVRQSPSVHDEELHSDLITLTRKGAPKGIALQLYHHIATGKMGNSEGHRYGVIIHGTTEVDANGNISVSHSSRSPGALDLAKRIRAHPDLDHHNFDPETGEARSSEMGSGHLTNRMVGGVIENPKFTGIARKAKRAVPVTILGHGLKEKFPLPDKK